MALGTAGPGTEIICGQTKSIVEIVMHHGCALHFPILATHTGTLRNILYLGDVRLNLLEST